MTQKLSCLVIEDNLFDQKMISRAAQCARIDVEFKFAHTLDEARDALTANMFAIILCDNNLPDGNGADFILELAQAPEYHGTTIVIVSGWPSPFMWAKARAAGIQIIDKNDQPQVRLMDVFSQKLRRNKAGYIVGATARKIGQAR